MYSTRFTFLLLLCLIIPFSLRLMKYEPYPAVLLPSGPQTVKKTQGSIRMEFKQVFGLNPNNNWKRIEPKEFMHPAPAAYLTNLTLKNMGFKELKPHLFNGRYALVNHFFRFHRGGATNSNTEDLRDWLKGRLAKSGYQTSKIRVSTYVNTISTANGEITKKELKEEKYYDLD
ncbi:hypothetical protein LT679_15770 [Mucilaginibacter roseus]|uniref:Uncharacterized protein n=1 Tax=Mucilaginibacter roseus TaxID=1528868 RepID=A0ABS8U639_9SPHI|nr:hypothetical protein [Mucilaginibacter roseus]MCD8742072.1 hypothetical protein [Mucilaginibacter roseus]